MQDQANHDLKAKSIERAAGRKVLSASARLEDVALSLSEASFILIDSKKAQRLANLARCASLAAEPLRQLASELIHARGGSNVYS